MVETLLILAALACLAAVCLYAGYIVGRYGFPQDWETDRW